MSNSLLTKITRLEQQIEALTAERDSAQPADEWLREAERLIDAHDDAWSDSEYRRSDIERLKASHAALLSHLAKRVAP